MGGFILPREILVTADSKGAFFGTLPPRLRGAEPPGGKKVRKERRRTAVVPSDNFYGITTTLRDVCESTD